MSIYEEVEFEDLDYDPRTQIYTYPCPCGDKFSISLEALWDGEDIATCPSCTLRIEIIYDEEDLPPLRNDDDDDDGYDEGSVEEGDDSKEEGKGEEDDEENKSEKENDEIDEGLAVVARKSLSVR
jgi:diphthamide biosynthesis protein 3